MRGSWLVLAIVVVSGPTGAQQSGITTREASVCDLSKRPDEWNRTRVRLSGIVSHEFESFLLSDPGCVATTDLTSIWITFGGRVPSGAVYCCPGEGDQTPRSKPLSIEGLAVPLVEDSTFRAFQKLLRRRGRVTARVKLVGTFFAGNKSESEPTWSGYGHFGCCALFAIEQVESFDEVKVRGENWSPSLWQKLRAEFLTWTAAQQEL